MKETFFRSEVDKSLREEWTLPPKRAAENAKLIANRAIVTGACVQGPTGRV